MREQLSSGARGVKAVRSRASLAGGDLLGRRALEPWRVASHELALKKKAGGLDALAVGADDFFGRECSVLAEISRLLQKISLLVVKLAYLVGKFTYLVG